MFGIKWNNKLKPSKVAKPTQPDQFKGFSEKGFKSSGKPKAWDVKGWKSKTEKAAEAKQKALDEETV